MLGLVFDFILFIIPPTLVRFSTTKLLWYFLRFDYCLTHLTFQDGSMKWLKNSFRFWTRTFLDVRNGPGRRIQLLLVFYRKAFNFHQLECGRAKQFSLWKWRRRTLPWIVEQGRQGIEMERYSLFFWDVLCLRSLTKTYFCCVFCIKWLCDL